MSKLVMVELKENKLRGAAKLSDLYNNELLFVDVHLFNSDEIIKVNKHDLFIV